MTTTGNFNVEGTESSTINIPGIPSISSDVNSDISETLSDAACQTSNMRTAVISGVIGAGIGGVIAIILLNRR